MKRLAPILVSLLAFVASDALASRVQAWPSSVRALYEVNFNGFTVGTFEFLSQSEDQSYTLAGNAHLTLLLGAFTWVGETRTFGLIANQTPKPAAFTFEFRANSKAGSTKIDFANGAVFGVKHSPPATLKTDAVPLREQHLKGVL